MYLEYVIWLALVACVSAFIPLAQTQSSPSGSRVPSDLSHAFILASIQLQVSYNDSASDGFRDGALLSEQETAKQPTFAFGDASGINTARAFIVMMVDTTSSTRALHFLQTDFKASGDKTLMESSAQPAFPYRAPLTMNEKGKRQYTFLLFQQTPNNFKARDVPTDGQNFDVAKWLSSNSLADAVAGVTLNVDPDAASNKDQPTSTSSSRPASASTSTSISAPPMQAASATVTATRPAGSTSATGSAKASGAMSAFEMSVVFTWSFIGLGYFFAL
ncbi:MAG: hypothetical protein M1839_008434 [Geoglossum umbratile]|nr:MAG: hypothetical protein M1839_008434 [Geoglossum umbratile]